MTKLQLAQLELDQIVMSQVETDNGLQEQIYEAEEARALYEFETESENAWLRQAEYDAEAQYELDNMRYY